MSYPYWENEIIIWARNRGIPQNSTPVAQARKTLEEAGELIEAAANFDAAKAYGKDDDLDYWSNKYRDALGDCMVTLVVGAETAGVDLLECLEQAYNEIKDRKGFLRPDGVFVKESV